MPDPHPHWANDEALLPQPVARDYTTHIYATKHGVELPLRLWAHPHPTPTSPWLLWTHGGGYCAGTPFSPPSWVIPSFRARGFHIVSAGYRLAPHANLADMLDDALSAVGWCRLHLAEIVPVDVDRWAAGGDSAGATLAALVGRFAVPRPRVVISVYGAMDLPRIQAIRSAQPVSGLWADRWGNGDEAENEVYNIDRDKTRASRVAFFAHEVLNVPIETTRERYGLDAVDYPGYSDRMVFQAQYKDWLGSRNLTYPTILNDKESRRLSPLQLVDECHPPMVFLHGEADVTVPLDHSHRMAKAVGRVAETKVISVPGAPHSFDMVYTGPEVEGWSEYIQPVVQFVCERVG